VLRNILIFLFFIGSFLSSNVYGQTVEEMKVQADKLFDKEQFVEATPLYLKLLTSNPRDYNINYHYGTCLLFSSNKKLEAFKYLNYAVTSETVDAKAFYYLGRAQHLNYQFGEAIANYTKYKTKAGSNIDENLEADRQIEMCENGKRLITAFTDLIVQEKTEIELDKFFRLYNLQNIGGSFLVTTDFQSKVDKKKEHTPLIHFPKTKDIFYYSSYGDDEKTGKDIYIRRKLPTGEWGQPQKVTGGVNTEYDEDYPFYHAADNFLYFSSKGHNSMGGYDVFRSKFNPETNSFGPAENMDFAISTPSDDMLYIVDSLNQNAYFSSTRQSQKGKVYVYKVRVEKVPLQLSVVKGNFYSTVNPENKKVYIEVRDYATGNLIGNFNSTDKGVYIITFPKGGKYEYSMRVEGQTEIYKTVVNIPFLKEFKPLKQKIVDDMVDNTEVVKVVDLFNEEVDDASGILAMVIKMKADLAPNSDQFDIKAEEKLDTKILSDLGIGNLRLNEVHDLLDKEVKEAEQASNATKVLENKINFEVVENLEKVNKLDAAIKDKLALAEKSKTPDGKYFILKSAESLAEKQDALRQQAKKDMQYVDSIMKLPGTYDTKKADELRNLNAKFKVLLDSNKQQEALQLLAANKTILSKALTTKPDDQLQLLIDNSLSLQEEVDALKKKINGFNENIEVVKKEVKALEQSKITAKSKEIESINSQIASKNKELEMLISERGIVDSKMGDKSIQKTNLGYKIDQLQTIATVNDTKTVSKQEAIAALGAIETTNSKTLKAYVVQQVKDLEKENPALKEADFASSPTLKSVDQNYSKKYNDIESNLTLSEADKNIQKNILDNQLINGLETKLNEIERSLLSDPTNEELLNSKKELTALKSKVQNTVDKRDESGASTLANNSSTTQNPTKTSNSTNASISNQPKDNSSTVANSSNTSNPANNSTNKTNTQVTNSDPSKTASNSTNTTTNKTNGVANNASNQSNATNPNSSKNVTVNQNSVNNTNSNSNNSSNQTTLDNKSQSNSVSNNSTSNNNTSNQTTNSTSNNQTTSSTNTTNKEEVFLDDPKYVKGVATTESVKETMRSITPNYVENMQAIENNFNLSKVEKLEKLVAEDELMINGLNKLKEYNIDQLKGLPNSQELRNQQKTIERALLETTQKYTANKNKLDVLKSASTQDAAVNDALITELQPNYAKNIKAAQTNTKLTELEKLKANQKEDNLLLNKINTAISTVDQQLQSNLSQELIEKKKQLDNLKTITKDRIEEREAQIAYKQKIANELAEKAKQDEIKKIANDIKPDHNSTVKKINASSIPEDEKVVALIAEEKLVIEKMHEVEKTMQEMIAKDPNETMVAQKLDVIRKSIQLSEQNIKDLDKRGVDYAISKIDTKVLVAEVDNKFMADTAKIAHSASPTKKEELAAREVVLQEKFSKIIQANEKKIAKSNDPSVKAENIVLKQQLAESNKREEVYKTPDVVAEVKEEKVAQPGIEIKEVKDTKLKENEAVKQELRKSLLAENAFEVDKKYTTENELVAQDDFLARYEEKIQSQLQPVLLEASKYKFNTELQQKKSVLEDELKTVKDKREEIKTSLHDMKIAALKNNSTTDVTSQNNSTKTPVTSKGNENFTVTDEAVKEVIADLNPAFESKIKSIEANTQLSKSDKANQIVKEEVQMLSALNNLKSSNEKQIAQNPTNQDLKNKGKTIDQAITDITESYTSKSADLVASQSTVYEALAKEVDPNYTSNKSNIQSNSKLTEIEKLNDLQKVDNNLLEKIDVKINSIDEQLKSNSTPELVTKKAQLEILKASTKEEIAERTNLIETKKQLAQSSTVKKSAETNDYLADPAVKSVIATINPSYESTINSIQSNVNLTEKQKLEKIVVEEKNMLSALENLKANNAKQVAQSPTNQDLKNKSLTIEKAVNSVDASYTTNSKELAGVDSRSYAAIANELQPSYKSTKAAINKDESLTAVEKLEALQKEDQQLIAKVDSKLVAVQTELKSNPTSENLITSKNQLEVLKQVVSSNTEDRAAQIALTNKIVNEIQPSYTKNVNSIQADNSKSPVEKSVAIQTEDQQLVASIDKAIETTKTELSSNPSSSDLLARKNALVALKASTMSNIDARQNGSLVAVNSVNKTVENSNINNNVVNSNGSNEASVNSVSEVEAQKLVQADTKKFETLANSVQPNYTKTISSIENSTDSKTDKLAQQEKENNILISKVEAEIIKTNSEIKAKSTPELLAKKADLEVLKTAKIAENKNIEKQLETINSSSVASNNTNKNSNANSTVQTSINLSKPSVKAVVNSINPNFESNIASISSNSSLSTSEKNEQIRVEEENMLKALNHLNTLNKKEIAASPNDVKLKSKETAIEGAIAAITPDYNEKSKNVAVANNELTTQNVLEEVQPTYQQNIASIQSNSTLSEVDRLKALQKEDQQLISKIDEKIADVDNQLKSNPTPALQNKKAKLETIKAETQESSQERQQLIASKENVTQTNEQKIAVEKLISEVQPDYESKVAEITSSNKSEADKTSALIKEEKALISKLNNVQSKDQNTLKKDPSNADLTKKVEIDSKAIEVAQANLTSLSNKALSIEESKIDKSILVGKIDPTYVTDITKIEASTSTTKQSDLVNREVALQEKLAQKVAENEKQIQKSSTPALLAENKVLSNQIAESKTRQANYGNLNAVASSKTEATKSSASAIELRQSILGDNASEVDKTYTTLAELKRQDEVLEKYEQSIQTRLSDVNVELEKNSQNTSLQEKKSILEEELKIVQNKRRVGRISIGELESVAVTKSPEQKQLETLTAENTALTEQLSASNLDKKQKAELEKKIAANNSEQAKVENTIVTNELAQQKTVNEQKTAQLSQIASGSNQVVLAQSQNTRLTAEAQSLVKQSTETKNIEEKNYLLNQALSKEVKANEVAQDALIDNTIKTIGNNEIGSLYTKAELEKKKRKYSIEIGELEVEIQKLDKQIATTKTSKATELVKSRDALISEKSLLESQVASIDKQIASIKEPVSTFNEKAIDQPISYKEERAIATTDEYKAYTESVQKAISTERKIAVLNADLEKQREETKRLIIASVDKPSEASKAAIKESITLIKSSENAKSILENQLAIEQGEANSILAKNPENGLKMQNLAQRGVAPVDKQVVIAQLVPLPSSGLEINTTAKTSTSVTPIPVDVKEPSGLVYRVQIGAFSKPIPQDLFSSFNPVSGEKIANTTITRYMAGYFNGATKAVEAQTQIKGLGYKDAFVIAYCDGKRISLAEARDLEKSGRCIPKGENELLVEVATNTAELLGKTSIDSAATKEVDELAYHEAINAVKATPAESRLGLFYTVQIGVYNSPVTAERLSNIHPIVSKRLPNGQIRYSSGMFKSPDGAKPKKEEAILRGIVDAFVTAYYKGERITLIEAKKLLDDNGEGILEPLKEEEMQISTPEQVAKDLENIKLKEIELKKIEQGKDSILRALVNAEVKVISHPKTYFVSKANYSKFPKEEMNHYNTLGAFYYDSKELKIKSAIVNSKDALPSLGKNAIEFDTLMVKENTSDNNDFHDISVSVHSNKLPGDVAEWLLQLNYNRSFEIENKELFVIFRNIPTTELEVLKAKIQTFGLTAKELSKVTGL